MNTAELLKDEATFDAMIQVLYIYRQAAKYGAEILNLAMDFELQLLNAGFTTDQLEAIRKATK